MHYIDIITSQIFSQSFNYSCGSSNPTNVNDCVGSSQNNYRCCFLKIIGVDDNTNYFQNCVNITMDNTVIAPIVTQSEVTRPSDMSKVLANIQFDCGVISNFTSNLKCGIDNPTSPADCNSNGDSMYGPCCYYSNNGKSICLYGLNNYLIDGLNVILTCWSSKIDIYIGLIVFYLVFIYL